MVGVAAETTETSPLFEADDAVGYDKWFDTRWGSFAFGIERRALDKTTSSIEATRVLDVGCGTGRFTEHLAARFGVVIGLDLAQEMLVIAARRVHGAFVRGNAVALPFGDGQFDMAVAITLCEFTSQPAAVVSELVRVVRPGGRVVVGSLNPTSLWGVTHRRRLHEEPWRAARFLARRQLLEIGAPHGQTEFHASLFAGSPISVPWVARALESIGARNAPAFGAFQVLVIEKAAT